MIFEKRKEYHKLRCKWRELKKEHSDLKQIEKIALEEFYNAAIKHIKENDLENPFVRKEDSKEPGNAEIFEEDETKAVFRKAAVKTHPDKGGEEHADVFKDIASAKKKGRLNELLEGARKVNIRPEEISIKQIDVLEEEANELEKKIDGIMASVHWIWYHANNAQRQVILENILNIRHA